MSTKDKYCIIGAGPSGLAGAKNLKDLNKRILKLAKNCNESNAEWLKNMVMSSKRVRRAIKFNTVLSDDEINTEIYYYEEEYIGDCWEEICFN